MSRILRILLIDDDADDREIFTWVMKSIDADLVVEDTSDGFEALDLLKQQNFDLVFLDLNMPRMHGLECLRRIRQIPQHAGTPVIVYSTSSNPRDLEESQAAKATDYIVKGHELSLIRSELTRALKKYDPRLSHTYEK